MPTTHTVLLLGATGRTGRLVLKDLLDRGVSVRVIVRQRTALPAEEAGHPALTVVEASLLDLPDEALRRHLAGCDAVVSCLGHTISLAGVLGPPRDLVTRAVRRVCRAVEALAPASPVKVVLMSSVSVHRPGALDARRGAGERAFLWVLRGLVPPSRDNQAAADFLCDAIGPDHPRLHWAVVRPDTLLPGEATAYLAHPGLVDGIFKPGHTRMANAARFMADLVTDPAAWNRWRSGLPVVVDAA